MTLHNAVLLAETLALKVAPGLDLADWHPGHFDLQKASRDAAGNYTLQLQAGPIPQEERTDKASARPWARPRLQGYKALARQQAWWEIGPREDRWTARIQAEIQRGRVLSFSAHIPAGMAHRKSSHAACIPARRLDRISSRQRQFAPCAEPVPGTGRPSRSGPVSRAQRTAPGRDGGIPGAFGSGHRLSGHAVHCVRGRRERRPAIPGFRGGPRFGMAASGRGNPLDACHGTPRRRGAALGRPSIWHQSPATTAGNGREDSPQVARCRGPEPDVVSHPARPRRKSFLGPNCPGAARGSADGRGCSFFRSGPGWLALACGRRNFVGRTIPAGSALGIVQLAGADWALPCPGQLAFHVRTATERLAIFVARAFDR